MIADQLGEGRGREGADIPTSGERLSNALFLYYYEYILQVPDYGNYGIRREGGDKPEMETAKRAASLLLPLNGK